MTEKTLVFFGELGMQLFHYSRSCNVATETFYSPQELGTFLYRYLNIAATEDISDLSSTCLKKSKFGRLDSLFRADAPALPDHVWQEDGNIADR